jgi:hypothetical protein
MHYSAMTKIHADTYKVSAPPLAELRKPLHGGTEFRGVQLLKGKGGKMETAHLRIAASVQKLEARTDGTQGFRADHLILSITNKSDAPIAYRVRTRVPQPERCGSMAQLPHNAIALRPRETVQRSECLFAGKQKLSVVQIDAYELTELGYKYVSRLPPVPGGPFDLRVAAAHNAGEIPVCRSVPWRDLEEGGDTFFSVVDFHARHDCDEYSMPKDYRPFTAPSTLPVCAGPAAAK